MANIDFPATPTVGQKYTFAGVTYIFSAQGVWSPATSVQAPTTPQGRLTLQPNVPVMSNTTIGQTAIQYTPYVGNRIPIYDGVNVGMRRFDEIQALTTDFTNQPAAIGVNKINDWFVVWDQTVGAKLIHGPDWTNDTTRALLLTRVEGLILNASDIMKGGTTLVPALRGTYVGTTMSDANSQFSWIYGAFTVPPTAGWFSVWNMYNRAGVSTLVGDATNSWSYSISAIRQINGQVNARVTYVAGIQEDSFVANTCTSATATSGGVLITGVGYDKTNAYQGTVSAVPNYNVWGGATGRNTVTSLGKHFLAQLESVNADGYPQTVLGGGSQGYTWTALHFDGRF